MIFGRFREEIRAVRERDPAVQSNLEVILAYPGLYALMVHRFSHFLYRGGLFLIPRIISNIMRFFTGVEIHPGAKIGRRVFIDHGMGVVIGETAEVGNDVVIYQGVTLGGTGKDTGKRHPTIKDNVVVSSGAKVLGPFTVGENSKIGAGAVVLKEVPPNCTVVGVPGRIVVKDNQRVPEDDRKQRENCEKYVKDYVKEIDLDQIGLPDPVGQEIAKLRDEVDILKRELGELKEKEPEEEVNVMKLYNSLSRKKEEFIPLEKDNVKMYVCGPTVYDYIHVGNARPLVVFDTLRRYFKYSGYDVDYVVNFTDIDDKIINKANSEGKTTEEISERYIKEYLIDSRSLNVDEDNTIHPKATENVAEIVEFIQELIDKGLAYEVDGDVYFEVDKVEDYGKLSKKNLGDLISGARVDINDIKKSPADFALWKKAKEGEPSWTSPWSGGRPGWHIECSVMARKYLGDTIDIHAGGEDLQFPHHENEIAQSESLTGKPFANYWLHNGMINIDNQKMSKSEGNFFTVRDIQKDFDLEVLRFFLLSAHYRKPLNFTRENMKTAKNGLDRIYIGKDRLESLIAQSLEEKSTATDKNILDKLRDIKADFEKNMNDDLNTADGITNIFEIIKLINVDLDENTKKSTLEEIKKVLYSLGDVLGILNMVEEDIDSEIEELIGKRNKARQNKDFKLADEIRDELLERGIILEDTADGVTWRRD